MAQPAFDISGLEQRVRERVDMVGSTFVSNTELDSYLEAAFQELYGIASAECEDLLVKTEVLSVAAGTQTLVIPTTTATQSVGADIKKFRGIRIVGDDFLSPMSLREVQNLDRTGRVGKPRWYWLFGDWTGNSGGISLELLPKTDTAYQMQIYFQPSIGLKGSPGMPAAALSALAGWDEYCVITAAIKCKDKEESSTSVLMAEKAQLLQNLRASWTPVDVSEAQRVVPLMSQRGGMRAYDYTGPDDDY